MIIESAQRSNGIVLIRKGALKRHNEVKQIVNTTEVLSHRPVVQVNVSAQHGQHG